MGFDIQYNLYGSPLIKVLNKAIAAADVINKGALLKNDTGAAKVEVAATGTLSTVAVYGVAQSASTATSTVVTIPVALVGPGTVLKAQIEEIAKGTALAATGGGATTFVDSTLVGPGSDDVLIGAVIETVTMASGDVLVGGQQALTDYTVSTGTCTFASVGSTGYAAADTAKLISVGFSEAASCRIIGEDLLDVNGEADMIQFDIAAGGDFCRVVDVTDDGKQLLISLTATYGNATVLTV